MTFIEDQPIIFITLVSLGLTLIVTLIYKFTTNQTVIKASKEEMKRIREELKANKGNNEKLMELNKRSLELSMEQMKHSFKPMIITFLPVILVFAWMRKYFSDSKVILNFGFNIPKMGDNTGLGWIGIYILTSLVFSFILRKLLKVE
ncbi:MAG TPA: EMC3/TMCO1 family protein [Candidatus Nanoarchaeia archaeon]|nr:hypothetical protein [uncultured archaeon]AQS34187.1 hypothetical protein [uncultured archaeon]HLC56565.1 EMC3/TMCO1 family protein [Candidatus Nanoarchaeia archaeon]